MVMVMVMKILYLYLYHPLLHHFQLILIHLTYLLMWYYQLYHYDSSSFIGVFHTTSGGVGGEEPHTKS